MKDKRFITKIALSIMTLVSALLVILFAFDNKNNSDSPRFTKNLGAYVTDKSELIDETGSGRRIASEYQRMNTLYDISSDAVVTKKEGITIDSTKAISISSAEELFAFSQLCLKDESFLAYDYALLNNIDYSKYDSNRHFYPIGCVGNAFSGSFNGNGYDIKGLSLAKLTDNSLDGVYSDYVNISYFAMFGVLTGSITNLGSINTNIEVNASRLQSTLQYISPLVGLNKGEISHVYATDLRDAETEEAGITAAGAYQLSGLVSVNEGTLNNAYTAYSIISNHTLTTTVTLWNEILLENKGSVSNLFFYNQSIVDGGYEVNGTTEIVTYDPILVRRKLERSYSGATYISSLRYLNDEVSESSSSWYTNTSYGVDLESSLSSIVTPILRGLTYDQETKIFKINNEFDYMYMYELFNLNSYYASSTATYEIQNDIDLKYIPTDIYVYNMNVGCKIIGRKDDSRQSVKTRTGIYSKYPTIFNATTKNMQINEGYNCYGVFPWFTGTIENLNFYFDEEISVSPSTVSPNISAVGLVTGYAENGNINNVNTYGKIVLGSNIGRVYAGQIAGIAGGDFSITSSTTSGKIEATNESTTYNNTSIQGNVSGSSFGGVVGFASDSYINLNDVLSVVAITVPSYAASNNIDIMAGGVLGSGYVDLASELENRGNININEGYYNNVYSAGIIGRILGVKQQINNFHNQGDIAVNANYATIYLAGCTNADIQTSTGTTGASLFKNKASKYLFYASSFSNAGKLFAVKASATASIAGVAMINSANGFISSISGFYNIGYKYGDDNFTKTHDSNPIEYNMKSVNSFGAVITSTATNINGLINATELFNFRSYKFFTTEASTKNTYSYSGCVNGSFVNGEDLRNEGNMDFVITNPIGNSTSSKLLIVGVMNEISLGCSLNKGYNAGNIDVTYSDVINGNVYVSGICYANRNSFSDTDINQFNPISSEYVNNKIGSINSVINAGHIEVASSNFDDITYSDTTILSANGASNLGSVIDTSFSGSKEAYISGDLFTSGIVTVNESVITNTFNIGDITAANYIKDTSNEKEVNASGISVLNYGGYAYILNSANDGNIKAINMSSGGSVLANVNASGITCRNDELENGNNYSGNASNSKQIISFTINYGSIYAYNYKYNITSTAQEPYSKAAGILAMGLCNIINVVNYGNIYGSETASGIFGVVYFNKFQSEVNSDVYIANTLNYGNVYMLERGYNYIHGSTYPDYEYIRYTDFISLDLESVDQYSYTTLPRNTDYLSIIGSVFSIVNFAESGNANNIKIRYLISFNDNLPIVGSTTAVPTNVNTDTTSFYSAYSTVNAETGATELDSWMGKYVNYIPLTTSTERKMVVTGKVNGVYQTASRDFNGAFSSNFAFRQATEGNELYLDIANNPTDKFIADYFQFVGYKYVNENLLDVIGWRSIAYQTAANEFAQNVEYVYKVINISSGVDDLVAEALKTETWLPYASTNTILRIVDELINSNDVEKLTSMLSYVFSSESSSNVLITPEVRESIYDKIIENHSDINLQSVLSSILIYENGYSKVLADSILNENDEVYSFINSYVSNLDTASLKNILEAYIEYLKVNSNSYFNYSSSEVQRYNILNALFSEINDDDFYSELKTILGITSGSSSSTIGMYNKYNSFNENQKHDLFDKIIANNSHNNLNTYLDSMQGEIGYFNELINNGYKYASMDAIYNSAEISSGSTSNSSTIVDSRVELWNQIRNTTTFKNYFNNLYGTTSTLFKATEYNNTFQSFTEPHNDGAYVGDTAENRLSYLYTKEITPKTYFYGPYNEGGGVPISSQTGNDLSTSSPGGYLSVFSAEDNNLFTSNELMKSRGGSNSTTTYGDSTTPSILMYYDLNNEQFGEATVRKTVLDRTFWTFEEKMLKSSKRLNDPMIGVQYSTSDWSGITFIETNDTITVDSTGETFSLNNAKMSGIFYNGGGERTLSNGKVVKVTNVRTYITDNNGTVHPVYGNIRVNGQTYNINNNSTNMQNIYGYLIDLYGVKIYTSTATQTLHSTGRTGIYRFSQPWDSVNYFTWKQSNKNKVYTSQYIDYNASDILNLDGILTEYSATTINSDDERYIINKMFVDYFLTSSNIEAFKKMVRVALFETLGSSSNAISFIDSFVNANIYTSTLINGATPFDYLKYTATQTVKEYLTPAAASINNKEIVINSAVSDANTFAKLLELIIRYNDTSITTETYNSYKALYNYILDHPEYLNGDNIDLSSITSETTLDALVPPLDLHNDISVSLDNITGTDIKSVYSNVTYRNRNEEEITTNYGFTFSSITFATPTDHTSVKVVAVSKNGSSTLAYSYSEVLDSIEVSAINTYSIPLANTSSITLTANNDIVIYEIYFEKAIEHVTYDKGETLTSADVAEGYYAIRISAPVLSNSVSIKNIVYMDGTTVTSKNDNPDQYTENQVWYYDGSGLKNLGTGLYIGQNGGLITSTTPLQVSFEFSSGYMRIYFNTGYLYYNSSGEITTGALNGRTAIEMYSVSRNVYYTYEYTDFLLNNSIKLKRLQSVELPKASELRDGIVHYDYINSTNQQYLYDQYIDSVTKHLAPIDVDNSEGYSNPFVNSMSEENQNELARLLIRNYNSSLLSFISSTCSSKNDLSVVYKALINTDGGYYYLSDALYYANINSYLTNDFKELLVAAYITADYANLLATGVNLSNSKMNTLLSRISEGYRYINSNSSFDNNKFEALCNDPRIAYPLGTTGYGIYALASSKGILNGEFLPDNLVLDSMDANYNKTVGASEETETNNSTLYPIEYSGSNSNITTETTTNAISSVMAKSSKPVSIKALSGSSIIQCGEYQFESELDLKGSGSTDSRSLKVRVPNKAVLTVFAVSGNASQNRALKLIDSSGNDLTSFTTTASVAPFSYSVEAGTYYFASNSGGIKIYGLLLSGDSETEYNPNGTATIELTENPSSSWRGNISNTESVQYAFDIEMKQLVKSISTSIFTLDLIAADNSVLYSSESSIDLENKTITYYVPTGFNLNGLTIDTYSMSLANRATLFLKETEVKRGQTTSPFNLNVGTNTGLIRVYAEETSVYADYAIIIVESDFSFDLNETNGVLSGNLEVMYKDSIIDLDVTSPSASNPDSTPLPGNLDLTPYITIETTDGVVMDNAYELLLSPIIDNTGSAKIKMEILQTLPTGTYDIVVEIYDVKKTYRFTKNPSEEHDILEFTYEGVNYTNDFNQIGTNTYQLDSTVKFGRAFTKAELSNYASDEFYLNSIKYSSGATLNVEVSDPVVGLDDLMTYTITYTVTAEDLTSATYIHNVKEAAPYTVGSQYVSVFQDGVQSDELSKNYQNNEKDNEVIFEIERGTTPINRVRYNLGGFYSFGNIDYSYESHSDYQSGAVTVSVLTAGISVVSSTTASAGDYSYNYIYTSSALWDGEGSEYERKYTFPTVTLSIIASRDATLHKITFISSASKLSTLSTVMHPSNVIRPTGDDLVTAENEISYKHLSGNPTANLINVTTDGIDYRTNGDDMGYADKSIKDYYIVGSVSNVNLSSYAPTFTIESMANIYQYTTLEKLQKYGLGKQDADKNNIISDKTILSNHDTTYIYVLYESGEETRTFLVELDENNNWVRAYDDTWAGDLNATSYTVDSRTHAIVCDGKNYTVSPLAGKAKANNKSLYMNYIGSPLTDNDGDDSTDNSHFWYVSYAVFSEAALVGVDNEAIKYYHIAMIDLENTNLFVFEVKTPTDFTNASIYLTLVYKIYNEKNEYVDTKTLSIFADYFETVGEFRVYKALYNITLLPRAYYYFNLSLPGGYSATYEITNGKANTNKVIEDKINEEGAYLPPASIIIQEVDITITLHKAPNVSDDVWGLGTVGKYNIRATLKKEE